MEQEKQQQNTDGTVDVDRKTVHRSETNLENRRLQMSLKNINQKFN